MNENIKLIINRKQIYHTGIVILVIIISFISGYELGKKWGRNHQNEEVVETLADSEYFTQVAGQIPKEKIVEVEKSVPEPVDSTTGQNFVASRNGTKFYPAGCKSVDRIKTENRVYFSNKDEAIRAGLEEATSC